MKFLPVVAEGVAVRQAALVSDESALKACLQRCAIQIDDIYLYLYIQVWLKSNSSGNSNTYLQHLGMCWKFGE